MSMESLIGATPMVALGPNLYTKLEYTNLTGSVKDRAALQMILEGEREGVLKAGATVIEPTSGNTGISLAAICARRGYRCVVVMPDSMSEERQMLMRAYGAEVVLTPGKLGMAGAVEKAAQLASQIPGGWIAGQFENPANAMAHYRTTGPEIWSQTQGKVDIFVAGVGTGGTITGVGRFLKEQNPKIRIVALEPMGSPMLSRGQAGAHKIQGIGANFVPQVLDRSVIDSIVQVSDEDALEAAAMLAREKGLLCGISSGAAYVAARKVAIQHPAQTVVTLFPDSGMRYLSTGLFDERR